MGVYLLRKSSTIVDKMVLDSSKNTTWSQRAAEYVLTMRNLFKMFLNDRINEEMSSHPEYTDNVSSERKIFLI
jgi:hypothetical protein